MGFYDGKSPLANTGSTAEISMITESPVFLLSIVPVWREVQQRLLKGFKRLKGSEYRWCNCQSSGK